MTLIFDANVSHKLVAGLAGEFPASIHVRDVGLREADDQQIWEHARVHGFVIVSKDTDFRERTLKGFRQRSCGLTLETPTRPRSRPCSGANANVSSGSQRATRGPC